MLLTSNNYKNITWKKIFTDYNLFYFFSMIIYTAQATDFTNVFRGFRGSYVAFLLPILLTVILVYKNKVSFKSRGLLMVSGIYFVWIILQLIVNNRYNITFTLILYEQIIIAYIIVQVYGIKIFSLFEQIVTKLSIMCVPVWALNLIAPSLIDFICSPISIHLNNIIKYNFIFVSVLNFSQNQEWWYRNPGFSWEPGFFACLLCTAIFCNLVVNKFKIKKNINLKILCVALITSFSTTGYTVFLGCILVLYLLQKQKSKAIVGILIVLPIAFFVFQLDFMSSKIIKLQSSQDVRDNIIYRLEYNQKNNGYDNVYVPQRFDGIMWQILNVQEEPILGYGLDEYDSFVKSHINEALAISEGLVKIFAKYGLVLGIILIVIFMRSSKMWAQDYKYKQWFFLLILYLMISISYPFFDIPLYMAVFYYGIFKKTT